MKNLFLTSSFADAVDLFPDLENGLHQGKTVTFIPTASLHEEVTFYVEAGKQALEGLGLIVDTLEVSTASPEEITNKLNDNDYIYITGGNTFFLLQALIKSGADKAIKEQIEAGTPYIGESAGSIILSPDIGYMKEMDNSEEAPDLESYEALNVIDFYPLPHYGEFPFREVTEIIVSKFVKKIKIHPFNNSQAIQVKGNRIESLG